VDFCLAGRAFRPAHRHFLLALFIATLALLLARWRCTQSERICFAVMFGCRGGNDAVGSSARHLDTFCDASETSTQLWLPGSLLGWGAQNMMPLRRMRKRCIWRAGCGLSGGRGARLWRGYRDRRAAITPRVVS
jgi:hypothetical protein